MEERVEAIENLTKFLNDAEMRIDKILTDVGWDSERIPVNRDQSSAPRTDGAKAKPSCVELDFPVSFVPSTSAFSVQWDSIKQAEVILEAFYENPSFELGVPLQEISDRKPPSNIAELQTSFTREERLTLYQEAVKRTEKIGEVPDVKIELKKRHREEDDDIDSLDDAVAQRRDMRRRNLKHRLAKNSLTYTEEVRNLIQLQGAALEEPLNTATKDKRENSRRHRRSSSRGDRSRSSKHRHDRRSTSPKHRRKRSRSRERSQTSRKYKR